MLAAASQQRQPRTGFPSAANRVSVAVTHRPGEGCFTRSPSLARLDLPSFGRPDVQVRVYPLRHLVSPSAEVRTLAGAAARVRRRGDESDGRRGRSAS